MASRTTVGKALLKNYLPIDLHSYVDTTILDKKGLQGLVQRLVDKDEVTYKKAINGLTRLGFEISSLQGSTVTLRDLFPPIDKDQKFSDAEKTAKEIRKRNIPKAEQDRLITELYQNLAEDLNKQIIEQGVREGKTLAKIVQSGSRGNATQYRQTIAGTVLVEDSKGMPIIDFPIKHSYAEGLSLPEYLASSFNARKNLYTTKLSVADSGALSKQLSRATATLKVEMHDCGTSRGINVSTDDNDYVGSYLSRGVGQYARNNEVTAKMLADLRNKKIREINVRSVMTCEASKGSHFGAVCSLCAGKREKGIPKIGDFVGITSATGSGEALSQGMLGSKHSGSIAGKGKLSSGFKAINQFLNPPSHFPDEAPIVEDDGVVRDVRPSPAGGTIVVINEKEYYVGQGLTVRVKKGDRLEKGDTISDGMINPAKYVGVKGIGEGRRIFSQNLKELFDNSGAKINKRNFDTLARSLIDNVQISDDNGFMGYAPDDIVSYSEIEKQYRPRSNSKDVRIDLAKGKYLEEPVLHYTIGTQVDSKIVADLKKNGIESVKINDNPPPFTPKMLRLVDIPAVIPDFFHQMNSTYLQRRLINSVNQGISSSLKGPSPITAIAVGEKIS